MPRPKIARKSTWVDMTAFCDVAFLLLSFFIMATKTKPTEAIEVMMPTSVSSKIVDDKDQILITLSKDGKVFFAASEPEKREAIVEEVAQLKGLSLSPTDAKKAQKVEFFGTPISQLPSYLNLPSEEVKGDNLPGIPVTDTLNNELELWLRAAKNIYMGEKWNLMVKGDVNTGYPVFKNVLTALKKNKELKFSIITNSEGVPEGSELEKANKLKARGGTVPE